MIGAAAIAALAHHRDTGGWRSASGTSPASRGSAADTASICDGRGAAPDPGQSGLRQHPAHHAVVDMQLAGDGADRSISRRGSSAGSAPRCQAASPWLRAPSGRVQHGRDDAGGDAGTLDGASGRQRRPHQWQCGTDGRRPVSRGCVVAWRSSSRPAAAEHPPAAGVNRDASLFLPRPVAAHPGGMRAPAAVALLIAPAGLSDGLAARPRGAAAGAVDLPAITTAADDHLSAAARTQEQTARSRLGLPAVADAA